MVTSNSALIKFILISQPEVPMRCAVEKHRKGVTSMSVGHRSPVFG